MIKCKYCGKFISYKDIDDGKAKWEKEINISAMEVVPPEEGFRIFGFHDGYYVAVCKRCLANDVQRRK